MASSTLALYDPQLSYTPPPLPYAENEDMGSYSGYGGVIPFFGSFCPPYFNLDPISPDRDGILDGSMSSAHMEGDSDYWGRILGSNHQLGYYEGEESPYYGQENWPTGADFIHRWQESFFSVGNYLGDENGNCHDSREVKEALYQSDEQRGGSYYKEEETQIPYAADEPSHGYWSWLEKQWEEYSQDNNSRQEPRAHTNDLELCESIFGYWPCMSRQEQYV